MPTFSLLQQRPTEYSRQWHKAQLVTPDGDTLAAEIRGRGHSTFAQPKHPYALRLSSRQSLLTLPANRRYVMLANFFDHSLLRNALALEAAKQTSLADCTPLYGLFSLNVDGVNQGVYTLTQTVAQTTGADSLLKLDRYHWDEQRAKSAPLDTIPANAKIDSLSFADYYILMELCMNAEPCGPRSVYMRLTPEGVLKAGPVWDFDMAFNTVGIDNGGDLRPERFRNARQLPPFLQGKTITWLSPDSSLYCAEAPIFSSLLTDANFRSLVSRRWHELRPKFNELRHYIRSAARRIRSVADSDQQHWNSLDKARFDPSTTWDTAVSHLQNLYMRRLKALDALLKIHN